MMAAELPLILAFIFSGCCSNVFALEMLVKDAHNSGQLITFGQFLFVALEGIRFQIEWQQGRPRIKRSVVPIQRWFVLVCLFFLVSILNNIALGYNISVPLHIIFRSGGLIVNMILGVLILGKRYSSGQVLGVVLVTLGVIWATLDQGKSTEGEATPVDSAAFFTGIAILVIAMILSAGMGLYQEVTYKKYGKQWREGLFYTHFLSLPFFAFFYNDIITQVRIYNQSTVVPVTSIFDALPVFGSVFRAMPDMIQAAFYGIHVPKLWAYLAMNVVTQYVCIAGVNRMTAVASSLTLNLVLNLRKFVSLIISIICFGNSFGTGAQLGTAMVILGTATYTHASRTVAVKPSSKEQPSTIPSS